MIDRGEEPNIFGLDLYIDAFTELGTCRQSGFGLAPIPFTAILEYCNLYSIENKEEFSFLIRRMDNTLLKLESAKDAKNGSNGN